MTTRFMQTLFTPAVRATQDALGSRAMYASHDQKPSEPDILSDAEMRFISERDSFYMASNSQSGWPYLQHRGGPKGFMRIVDNRTLGFADFRGNRQYVSVGNMATDNRVCLFLMDYPNRSRLKLLGHMTVVEARDAADLGDVFAVEGYRAAVERYMLIRVEAYDWNCPQHITQRFTAEDMQPSTTRMTARIAELEAELAELKAASQT